MNDSEPLVHTPISIPMELWGAIFRRVERKDLTTLARVSRLFHQEAEYVLYHLVDLRDTTDGARLALWCTSIIVGETRHRRASRVHTLWFPRYFDPPKSPPDELAASSADIQQLLSQAFKAVVNLKELYIFGRMVEDSGVPTISPSTFENCTFRLTGIAGSFTGLTAEEMWAFLSTQPDISYWVPSDPFIKSTDVIPPRILPAVREMVLVRPERLPLLYDRPLQKLVLTFQDAVHTKDEGFAVIRSLRRFEETLRVLSYMVFGSLKEWTILEVIRALALDAPNLESLAMFVQGQRTVGTDDQKDLIEAISRFKHLHSLVFSFRMAALRDPNTDPPDPSNPLEHDPIWAPGSDYSPAQCRKVASMFMVSCPSLWRISFPFMSGEGEVVDVCYRRLRGGAVLEGFYGIDSTSWWMR